MQCTAKRNIILLSDGTGNSSVSQHKTNVWRLYQALNLDSAANGCCRQMAFYDDGVGTLGFKPLQILGGAFGWGLSRNVRELYENLCRHYRPGDRIYIFGFSRGAFTARVLAHFICTCGILDQGKAVQGNSRYRMDTDRGLRKGVRRAYKSYRHFYWRNASPWLKAVSFLPRKLRNLIPRWKVLPDTEFKKEFSYQHGDNGSKLVEFVGVWDTVDAVGLPIDELSTVLDSTIYPYKFPDCDFPKDVARGCQALAIDDERHSFHPLLWNEDEKNAIGNAHDVKQVWFAGMHSNVGGSYPEDHLAFVSLSWMIDECQQTSDRAGLLFKDEAVQSIKQQLWSLGKMYDSRRGAGVYYRYKPRDITELCNQKQKDWRIKVETPKVHHTVLDRIADSKVGYAPTSLPRDFVVVGSDGRSLALQEGERHYETSQQRDHRAEWLERSKNHIFWRRFAYYFLLVVTSFLVIIPHLWPPIPGLEREDWLSWIFGHIFDRSAAFLPAFTSYWTEAWIQSPYVFASLLVALGVFYIWSSWIKGNIQQVTETGWWHLKIHEGSPPFMKHGLWEAIAGWFRSLRLSGRIKGLFKRYVLPIGFSGLCIMLVLGAIYRLGFHYPAVKDGACILLQDHVPPAYNPKGGAPKSDEAEQSLVFETSNPCFETSYVLEKGQRYKINVQILSNDKWKDLTIPASYDGFENEPTDFHPLLVFMIPTRRHLTLPWFTLVGEVGKDSGDIFPINKQDPIFTSPAAGRLYLYVNDAVNVGGLRVPQEEGSVFLLYLSDLANLIGFELPLSKGQLPKTRTDAVAPYKNNIGSAIVTVSHSPSR